MPRWACFATDLVGVSVLVFAVYFPRYRRRDLVVAYLAVNVGVMAVIVALTSSVLGVGVGAGFGLFGVLSIVRLRSTELAQQELAYYFISLALGLLGGLEIDPPLTTPALSALMVAAVAVGDSPRVLRRYRHQILALDRAFTDETALVTHLERILGAKVKHLLVQRTDLVNDTTLVDVRYRLLDKVTEPFTTSQHPPPTSRARPIPNPNPVPRQHAMPGGNQHGAAHS
jgi:hypothetical protein